MAKNARGSSSSGASRDATTGTTPVDVDLLHKAADELQYVANRPYAASLIRTFLAEHEAAAERAEE